MSDTAIAINENYYQDMKYVGVAMNEKICFEDKKPELNSRNSAPHIRRKTESFQTMNSPVDRILYFQRTIGNQAVGRLIKSGDLQAKLRIGQHGDIYEQEADRVAEKGEKKKEKTKAKKNPCDRDIWFEGTCQFLVDHSKYICCDPDKGLESKKKRRDIEGKECPSNKWTPIFSCDNNCKKALGKGCDDNDNWMAVPKGKYKCNDELTICYNGNQTKGYVRDNSVVDKYEVSPGIKDKLGVTEKQGFKGAVYRPGAKQEIIDKDTCCKNP